MTYIPADEHPRRSRSDQERAAPRRRAGSERSVATTETRVIPSRSTTADRRTRALWEGFRDEPTESITATRSLDPQLDVPPAGAAPAPVRPTPRPPQPVAVAPHAAYPGQAAYQYGSQAAPLPRDVSAGIVAGQLVRAMVLFGLAAGLAWMALRTVNGQWLDEVALQEGRDLAARLPAGVPALIESLTLAVGAVSAVAALILAASTRRWAALLIAVATAVAAMACVQVLKHGLLTKAPYGVQENAQNSLPSGHTAAAAAAVAVVLMVAPARLRKPLGLLGAVAVTAAGFGTVINGWHRPSDVVVAVLVVTGWFVLGGILLRLVAPGEQRVPQRGGTLLGLTVLGAALLMLILTVLQTVPTAGLALAAGGVAVLTVSLLASHQLLRSLRPRRR